MRGSPSRAVLTPMAACMILLASVACARSSACAAASGPATTADGPVSITLDHTNYGPDAPVRVTTTNHTNQPLVVYWHMFNNCLPFFIDELAPDSLPASTGVPRGGQFCQSTEMDPGYWDRVLLPGTSVGDKFIGANFALRPGRYQIEIPYAYTSNPNVTPSKIAAAVSQEFSITAC